PTPPPSRPACSAPRKYRASAPSPDRGAASGGRSGDDGGTAAQAADRAHRVELVAQARDGGSERLVHVGPDGPVDLAGVLVHEELLDLDGQAAGLAGEPGVNPAGQVPSPEPDVLPHVEGTATHLDGAEVGGEAVDEAAPPLPVERPGAHVDVGIAGRVGRRGVDATPVVVVAVQVEDDERAAAVAGPGQDSEQFGVEPVVEPQRPLP